ncbi:MAG: MG2 domain-containing protein [Lysobacterales bacterium]
MNYRSFWLLLAGLYSSVALAVPAKVESVRFEENYSRQSIQVEFDQPMATWGQNSLFETELLRTTPQVPCIWYWIDDRHLLCDLSDAKDLSFASNYTLEIGAGFFSLAGEALPATRIAFETPRPKLTFQSCGWLDDDRPQLEIATNQPIQLESIHQHLSLEDAQGLRFATQISHTKGDPEGHFQLTPSRPLPPGSRWQLKQLPGLTSPAGPLVGLPHTLLTELKGRLPLQLKAIGCDYQVNPIDTQAPHQRLACGSQPTPKLVFNQPLSDSAVTILRQQLSPGLRLIAAQANRYHGSNCDRPEYAYAIEGITPGMRQTLVLDEHIADQDGSPLRRSLQIDIAADDAAPLINVPQPALLFRPGQPARARFRTVNLKDWQISTWDSASQHSNTQHFHRAKPPRNQLRTHTVRLPRGLRRDGGILLGQAISGASNNELQQPRFIVGVAAFGVVAIPVGEDLSVLVYDWDNGEPIADAAVTVAGLALDIGTEMPGPTPIISTNTDARGLVSFTSLPALPVGQRPLLIVQKNGAAAQLLIDGWSRGDQTYDLRPASRRTANSRVHSAVVFGSTDKLLYLPGETVHYRMVVREWQRDHYRQPASRSGWKVEASHRNLDLPLATSPALTLDEFGVISGELRIPEAAYDGRYSLDLIDPQKLADPNCCWGFGGPSVEFAVAAAKPSDFAITVKMDRPIYRAGDPVKLRVRAHYLNGGALSEARFTASSLIQAREFPEIYPAYADYEFAPALPESLFDDNRVAFEGELSGALRNGVAVARGQVTHATGGSSTSASGDEPEAENDIVSGELLVSASVSAANGATVTSPPATALYLTFPHYLGLRLDPLKAGAEAALESIAVAADGQTVAQVAAELSIDYRSNQPSSQWSEVARCKLTVPAVGACGFRPNDAGVYRFGLAAEGAAKTILFGTLRDESHGSDKGPLIRLNGPDQPVLAGAPAHFTLTQPFPAATALLSIERDGILAVYTEPVTAGANQLSVATDARFAPGVTVAAYVIPRGQSAFPDGVHPRFLHAKTSLHVETPASDARFTIAAPTTANAGAEVEIALRSVHDRPLAVNVLVIDAGVVRYVSDLGEKLDPRSSYWQESRSRWSDAEYVALAEWAVAAPGVMPKSETHQYNYDYDYDFGGGLERVTVVGSRISAANIFNANLPQTSGKLPLAPARSNAQGVDARIRQRFANAMAAQTIVLAPNTTLRHALKLPDNLTEWRVYAWAVDDRGLVALQRASIRTGLPLEVRLRHPAHAIEGDRVGASASARNHGDGPMRAQMTLSLDSSSGPRVQQMAAKPLAANAELSITTALADAKLGAIKVLAQASSDRQQDQVASQIDVRSASARQTSTQTGIISGLAEFPAPTVPVRVRLNLLRLPFPDLSASYAYLRNYPHSCFEQQTSRVLALTLAEELSEAGAMVGDWPDRATLVAHYLQEMPMYLTGYPNGFQYFPGWRFEADPFLSSYVAMAIPTLEAHGLPIAAQVRETLKDYLNDQLTDEELVEQNLHAPDARAFLAAGLASLAGSSALDVANLPDPSALKSGGALAAMLIAIGDDQRFAEQHQQLLSRLETQAPEQSGRRAWSGAVEHSSLGSNVRDQCLILRALVKTDRREAAAASLQPWLIGLADLLGQRGHFGDTQSTATCLLALADFRSRYGQTEPIQVTAAQGRQVLGKWQLDRQSPRAELEFIPDAGMPISLHSPGLAGFSISSERQIDLRRATPTANGLGIERSYSVLRNGHWQPIGRQPIRQGETVRIQLVIHTARLEHMVAVTDPLPAGLGSLNPTLANTIAVADREAPGSWWFSHQRFAESATYQYAEYLPPGRHQITYFARAEHAGSYAALPAKVELMYADQFQASTAAGMLVIGSAMQ